MLRNSILVPEDHKSIQDALDEAVEGSIIKIDPGIYKENIEIDKKDIALIGPNAGVPGYVDQREDEAMIKGSVKVLADVKDVTLEGLKFFGKTILNGDDIIFANNVVDSPSDGLVTHSVSPSRKGGFLIKQNKITTKDSSGILLFLCDRSRSFEVVKNVIKGCRWGIKTYACNHPSTFLRIFNNDIIENEHGLLISSALGKVSISYNSISKNEKSGLNAGSKHLPLNDLEVKYNQIIDSDGSGITINSENLENVQIKKNNIFGHKEYFVQNRSEKKVDASKNFLGGVRPDIKKVISGRVDCFPCLGHEVNNAGSELTSS